MLKELITVSEKAKGSPMAVPAAAAAPVKATSSGIDATI